MFGLMAGLAGTAHANPGVAEMPPLTQPPARVVSMNLCTDQLAMMLAAPGQLLSVSYLALDQRASAMPVQAAKLVINHGKAEEIYLLQPDLVIAGAYSTRATVDMLRRLGVPVAVLQPARSLDEVRDRILEIGTLLGREAQAQAMIDDYDTRLAAVQVGQRLGPRAALYAARGWTSGDKSLAGQILIAAGLRNVATEVGFAQGGRMPLEVLAMTDPDVVVTSGRYRGQSRAQDVLAHPVVQQIPGQGMRDSDWVCGTPFVLRAIEGLAEVVLRFEDKED